MVSIPTPATSSGTSASSEPNTSASTASAPSAPSSVSATTPGSLDLLPALSAGNPVTETEAPGSAARSVAVMALTRADWLSSSRPLPGVNTRPNVVLPFLATKPRSPVDAQDTTRTAGSFLAMAPNALASSARM